MNSFLEKSAALSSWLMMFGRRIFLCVVVILIVMKLGVTAVKIDGHSMDPTLHDKQWVAVNLLSKNFNVWNFQDVAILKFPGDPLNTWYVKRVIGLPGDKVEIIDGDVWRNGTKILEDYLPAGTKTYPGVVNVDGYVPENKYLVLGDNREISNDSRFFGYVPEEDMYGQVIGY